MKIRKLFIMIICFGVLIAGCSSGETHIKYAKTENLLNVGIVGAYINNDTYKSIYEPLIKKCALAVYGNEDSYNIIKTNSATQLYMLDSSDIDVSLLLVPKTDTLLSSYALSDPYYKDEMVVIGTCADMKLSDINGKHIGILNDSAQTGIYKKAIKDAGYTVDTEYFASYPDLTDALSKGNITVIVGPKMQLQQYLKDGQYVGESFAEIEYCIAADKDNSKWIDAINKAMKQ